MPNSNDYPPRLDRKTASNYLYVVHGIKLSPATLAKYASVGGGPLFRKIGRRVAYDLAALDEYAAEIVGPEKANTTQL